MAGTLSLAQLDAETMRRYWRAKVSRCSSPLPAGERWNPARRSHSLPFRSL